MNKETEKRLLYCYILLDLLKMKTRISKDFSSVMKLQNRRVRHLAKKAYQIPFYKKRFDEAGITPADIKTGDDLAKLPLLTKTELREWMSQELLREEYQNWFHYTTSGSSGTPLTLPVSPKEKAYNMANWLRVMLVAGYNPFFGKTMNRQSANTVTQNKHTFFQRLILRQAFVAQYNPEPDVIKEINAYKPDFLYMNKSELMRICLYSRQHSIPIHRPKLYCPTGEMIDEAARQLFSEVLGPMLLDSYGTAETGAAMVKLPQSREYIIHHDSFVVNIYDSQNQPSTEGTIVITPLYKTDLPLINYVIGDRGTCEIRNGVRFVTSVQGRENDFFRYSTGEVTTFFEIAPIIARCKDIQQIRFIQESYEKIRVQCVQNKTVSQLTCPEIESMLTTKLNERFKHPFTLEYEWMDCIPPDPNGKIRVISCNIPDTSNKT